jgi:hypothetical protein
MKRFLHSVAPIGSLGPTPPVAPVASFSASCSRTSAFTHTSRCSRRRGHVQHGAAAQRLPPLRLSCSVEDAVESERGGRVDRKERRVGKRPSASATTAAAADAAADNNDDAEGGDGELGSSSNSSGSGTQAGTRKERQEARLEYTRCVRACDLSHFTVVSAPHAC